MENTITNHAIFFFFSLCHIEMFSRVIKLLNYSRNRLTIFPVSHHIFWVSIWHSRALKLHESGRQLGGGALCALYVVWFWGVCLFKTGSSSAAQSGFELKIFMPRPLEPWDYGCEAPTAAVKQMPDRFRPWVPSPAPYRQNDIRIVCWSLSYCCDKMPRAVYTGKHLIRFMVPEG